MGDFFKTRIGQITVIAVIVLVPLLFALFTFTTVREQKAKLLELEQERISQEERIDELSREEERILSDSEFSKSRDGRLQYARDELGYIMPGDIRVKDGN